MIGEGKWGVALGEKERPPLPPPPPPDSSRWNPLAGLRTWERKRKYSRRQILTLRTWESLVKFRDSIIPPHPRTHAPYPTVPPTPPTVSRLNSCDNVPPLLRIVFVNVRAHTFTMVWLVVFLFVCLFTMNLIDLYISLLNVFPLRFLFYFCFLGGFLFVRFF